MDDSTARGDLVRGASVFLVARLREFGWSRSILAGAFSVFTRVHGAVGLPLGWLADRAGPRRREANAVGGSFGPLVAGRVFDTTGGYAPAIAAAALATGVLWATRGR